MSAASIAKASNCQTSPSHNLQRSFRSSASGLDDVLFSRPRNSWQDNPKMDRFLICGDEWSGRCLRPPYVL